jgi:UDP-2,3-diacylglucosamine hydrolase
LKYRMLKSVLRSKAATWGFRVLHPELGMRIAHGVSSTDEKRHHDRSSATRSQFLQDWAREQFAADAALGWVICGHSHVPLLLEIAPGQTYINSGDWVMHRTYVTIDDSGVARLLEY